MVAVKKDRKKEIESEELNEVTEAEKIFFFFEVFGPRWLYFCIIVIFTVFLKRKNIPFVPVSI